LTEIIAQLEQQKAAIDMALAALRSQQLRDDFVTYLDGFSPNVQEILDNFAFRSQIPRLSKRDVLGSLIAIFLDPRINLGPDPVYNGDGSLKHPGLDNHAMGTIFEELVRRFNEENNEDAGEHRPPRDAVKLMVKLIFLPIADQIERTPDCADPDPASFAYQAPTLELLRTGFEDAERCERF
jgi:type I restriction-modification system DNA methylase subunit